MTLSGPKLGLTTLASRCLTVAELHHVAALHDVLFALDAGLACRARLRDGAGLDQVVVRDDLGLDEALLEIDVDPAGDLRTELQFAEG